jgi:hypothetical protein
MAEDGATAQRGYIASMTCAADFADSGACTPDQLEEQEAVR